MRRVIVVLIVFLFSKLSVGQNNRPEFMHYLGSSRAETKDKLKQYLDAFRYEGYLNETDTTIDIVVSKATRDWKILTSFYFGDVDSCQSISTVRCDKYKDTVFNNMFNNKQSHLIKLNDSTYVTDFATWEIIEILRNDSCLVYRKKKLGLRRKAFKALVRDSKHGG